MLDCMQPVAGDIFLIIFQQRIQFTNTVTLQEALEWKKWVEFKVNKKTVSQFLGL